jgi:small redox-active disulfide protein 2
MKIQILGAGCPKCKALESNARDAVTKTGVKADIEKITDIDKIMEMGVMVTPGLVIDGEVKKTGKVLSANEIAEIIKEGNSDGGC